MSAYPPPNFILSIWNIKNYTYLDEPLTIGEGNELYYSKNGGEVNGNITQTTFAGQNYKTIRQTAQSWGFDTLADAAICTQSNENASWAINRGSTAQFASIGFFTAQNQDFRIGFIPTIPTIGSPTGTFRILYRPSNSGVQLVPTATTWSSASDIRYKENVVDLEDGMLDKILSLRTIKYSCCGEAAKEPTKIGIIAQELQEQGLGIVVDEEESLSVRYTELIPILIKAVQELTERVKVLEGV